MKKIITTILVLILVFLLGWIGYDLFIKNTEEPIVENEIENLKVLLEESEYLTEEDKIDSSMPFVYEIAPTYELEIVEGVEEKNFINEFKTTNEQVGEYSIPYININIDGIDFYNNWLKMISLATCQATDSIYNIDSTYLKYSIFENTNGIYSILVEGSIDGIDFVNGINIDLINKKIIKFADIDNMISHEKLLDIFKKINSPFIENEIDYEFKYEVILNAEKDLICIDPIFFKSYKDENDIIPVVEKEKVYEDNKYLGYILKELSFLYSSENFDTDVKVFNYKMNASDLNCTYIFNNNEITFYERSVNKGNDFWIYNEIK